MKRFSIRQFTPADIDFAIEMNAKEQWGDTRSDVERMFDYEPNGCFVAEADGRPAGHIFSVNYGKLGWIGLLIVNAEYRRNGIGTLLTKRATEYLLSHGVETIKLEAVPAIANLYRKLGFSEEYESLRFLGISRKMASATSSNVKSLNEATMKKIAGFDAEYFGANRTNVLTRLYLEYPKLCFVSTSNSRITGYIMCRETKNGYRVGPWVCEPDNLEDAKGLLMECIEKVGQNVKVYVGVPAMNEMAVEILQESGFEQYSKSIRMRFGKELETECISGIFAIGGPEKG